MTDYTSPEFLTTPQGSDQYDNLDWHNKIKIKALEGLDQLAANLNAIANIKAIEFQINHLNDMSDGFNAQLTEKDVKIAQLTTQLANIESTQIAALEAAVASANADSALLQAEIVALKAANTSLQENFNKFKSVLTSIDTLTDEVID
jgi:hypothetical protein